MKLSLSFVKPGMVLKTPVYSNRGGFLLKAGYVLTDSYIQKLKSMGILAVNIQEALDVDTEEADKILEDEVKLETLVLVQDFIEKKFSDDNYHSLVKAVENIVEEILSGKIPAGGLAEISAYDSYTYAHSVDVCALSVAIGYHMGFFRPLLLRLGMGSLLHDLGKTRIPLEILNKPGELTSEEQEKMREHPLLGYNIVINEFKGKLEAQALQIIMNHHERYDGSGYPNSLKGSQLSTLDMICGIADMYSAMTSDRVYRKAFPYSEAYEMLLGSADSYFSIDIVQAFAKSVEPYPTGTFVQMSDGRKGYVIKSNPHLPTRPSVKILSTEEIVDLSKNLSLVIKSQLPQEEVSTLVEMRDV